MSARRRPTPLAAACLAVSLAVAVALSACGRAAPRAVPAGSTEAERVVRAQFEAYNRRDLDAFMATLAPDARLYVFPDSLLYAGHAQLRPVYARLFTEATGLRAVVHDRIVQGRYVIDRETTYGLPGRAPLTGVAISEVRDGRIVRVWFVD